MPFRLRPFQVFRTVMETGSVTEAARILNVSQPAVSRALQQAEDELGFPLFVRERGGIQPTAEARALLPELLRAFAAIEVVQRFSGDLKDSRAGLVIVAATPALANSLLPAAIRRFRAERPEVRVALHTVLNHEVVDMVAGNRAELGLVLIPAEDSATLARELCAGDLVCITPQDHPLAGRRSIAASDLLAWPLISFSASLPIGALIEDAFERQGLRRAITIEVTQSSSACALVRAGAGVAVVDSFALSEGAEPGLAVLPFTPSVHIRAKLLSGRHRPPSRLARIFVGVVETIVAEHVAAGRLHAPRREPNPLAASGPAASPRNSAASRLDLRFLDDRPGRRTRPQRRRKE